MWLILFVFIYNQSVQAQVFQVEASGFQFRAMSGYTTNFVGPDDYRKVEMSQSNFIVDYGFSNDQQIILNTSILTNFNPDYNEETNTLNDTVITYRKMLTKKLSVFRNVFFRASGILPTSEVSEQDHSLKLGSVLGVNSIIPIKGPFFLMADLSYRQNFHELTTDGSGDQNINYAFASDLSAGFSATDVDIFFAGLVTASAFDYGNDFMDTELTRFIGYNRSFPRAKIDLLVLVQEGSALVLNRNGNLKDFDFFSSDTASITFRGTIRF